jgi:hypothetical protein
VSEHTGDAPIASLVDLNVADVVAAVFGLPVDEDGLAGRQVNLEDLDGNRHRIRYPTPDRTIVDRGLNALPASTVRSQLLHPALFSFGVGLEVDAELSVELCVVNGGAAEGQHCGHAVGQREQQREYHPERRRECNMSSWK